MNFKLFLWQNIKAVPDCQAVIVMAEDKTSAITWACTLLALSGDDQTPHAEKLKSADLLRKELESTEPDVSEKSMALLINKSNSVSK